MEFALYLDIVLNKNQFKVWESDLQKDYPKSHTLIVAGNAPICEQLVSKGWFCKPVTDFLSQSDVDKCYRHSLEWAGKWFLDAEGNDPTRISDFSLGKALKYPFHLRFNHILKSIQWIRNFLDRERPKIFLAVKKGSPGSTPDWIWDVDIHPEVLEWFAKQHDFHYQTLFYKDQPQKDTRSLLRETSVMCQESLKPFIIGLVDGWKSLFFAFREGQTVQGLVASASDLTYLGKDFVRNWTQKSDRALYYLEKEKNCYFNLNIRHVGDRYFQKRAEVGENQEFLLGGNASFQKWLAQNSGLSCFRHLGAPILTLGAPFFRKTFENEFPDLVRFTQVVQRALKSYSFHSILLTNHNMPYSSILAQLALKNGIPVIYIPHGHSYGGLDNGKKVLNPGMDPAVYPYHFTCQVMGLKINDRFLTRKKTDSWHIIHGGIPRLESIQLPPQPMRRNLRRKFGFKPEEWVVLFGTTVVGPYTDRTCFPYQYDSFNNMAFYRDLLEIFLKLKGYRLAITFRPSDILLVSFQEMLSEYGLENVTVFIGNLEELLLAADVNLAMRSNVGIEALFYHLFNIQYVHPKKPNTLPLTAGGAAIPITSLNELPLVLDRLRNDQDFREQRREAQIRFLKENLPDSSINPGQRILDIINRFSRASKW